MCFRCLFGGVLCDVRHSQPGLHAIRRHIPTPILCVIRRVPLTQRVCFERHQLNCEFRTLSCSQFSSDGTLDLATVVANEATHACTGDGTNPGGSRSHPIKTIDRSPLLPTQIIGLPQTDLPLSPPPHPPPFFSQRNEIPTHQSFVSKYTPA